MSTRRRFAVALASCFLPDARAADLASAMASLRSDRDPERLEAAAVAIARSGDARAMAELARQLGTRSFLLRLDPPRGSDVDVVRLGRVFRALAEQSSQAGASLCIALADSRDFTAVPARLNLLLNALAATRPMSEAAALVFAARGRTGFFEVAGPLLAANASPRALDLLAQWLGDESLDPAQRISVSHWALLPNRDDAGVVAMCTRLLRVAGLSRDVAVAVLESLFDYRPRVWFGLRAWQPSPPAWSSTPDDTRELLRALGDGSLRRQDLSPELRAAIISTLEQLR